MAGVRSSFPRETCWRKCGVSLGSGMIGGVETRLGPLPTAFHDEIPRQGQSLHAAPEAPHGEQGPLGGVALAF